VSRPAFVLPDSQLALTALPFTTSCCITITKPALPTALYEKSVSRPFTFTSPVTGLGVGITSDRYTAAGKNSSLCTPAAILSAPDTDFNSSAILTFSPAPYVNFNQTQSWSLTVSTPLAGCYRLRYTIADSANASRFNPIADDILFILPVYYPPPPPSLKSVAFSNTGTTLLATFTSPVDQSPFSPLFPCSQLLVFNGSTSSQCSWSSSQVLVASLPPKAVVVPGSPIPVIGGILRATCSPGLLGQSVCDARERMPATTAIIQAPRAPIVPIPAITFSPAISFCTDLAVSGSGTR
jgi:hypothetical protein